MSIAAFLPSHPVSASPTLFRGTRAAEFGATFPFLSVLVQVPSEAGPTFHFVVQELLRSGPDGVSSGGGFKGAFASRGPGFSTANVVDSGSGSQRGAMRGVDDCHCGKAPWVIGVAAVPEASSCVTDGDSCKLSSS